MNTIREALDILATFEEISCQQSACETMPEWIVTESQRALLEDHNIELSFQDTHSLLEQDQYLLNNIKELGLAKHSPARFALGHTAHRLEFDQISMLMTG